MTTKTDTRAAAIRVVESEFMHMAGRFRRLVMRRAERLSPGLLPGSYKAFTAIIESGPITASDIAEQLMVDKGQMSRTIASLEERGLITRSPDPHDRRAQLLEATESGLERFNRLREDPSEKSLRSRLEEWEIDDIARLGELLHALNTDADEV